MFVLSANGQMLASDVDDDTCSVTLETADGTEWRCSACGAELSEDVDGYTDDTGAQVCHAYDPEDDPHWRDGDAGPDIGDGPHRPERIPLSWANSAGIHTDPDVDSITLTVSVGDPRGAFAFTLRRVPDETDTSGGRLMLHVPSPEDVTPHAGLTLVHPGTYRVG